MQHYSKIVLQALSHRQELIHLYGFTHIFGYPRKKQAFIICTTSTDKQIFFILWVSSHYRFATPTRQTFLAPTAHTKIIARFITCWSTSYRRLTLAGVAKWLQNDKHLRAVCLWRITNQITKFQQNYWLTEGARSITQLCANKLIDKKRNLIDNHKQMTLRNSGQQFDKQRTKVDYRLHYNRSNFAMVRNGKIFTSKF